STDYDAVVLDVLLPGIDGFETCRRLRSEGSWAPILLLTARDAVEDRIAGLDGGADDYLTKPFSFGELTARLRALARRGAGGRRQVRRRSLRLRLTLAFGVVMAVLLALTGLFVYRTVRSDLNNSIDRSLKSRAAQLAAAPVPRGEGDDFSQLVARDGRVVA